MSQKKITREKLSQELPTKTIELNKTLDTFTKTLGDNASPASLKTKRKKSHEKLKKLQASPQMRRPVITSLDELYSSRVDGLLVKKLESMIVKCDNFSPDRIKLIALYIRLTEVMVESFQRKKNQIIDSRGYQSEFQKNLLEKVVNDHAKALIDSFREKMKNLTKQLKEKLPLESIKTFEDELSKPQQGSLSDAIDALEKKLLSQEQQSLASNNGTRPRINRPH